MWVGVALAAVAIVAVVVIAVVLAVTTIVRSSSAPVTTVTAEPPSGAAPAPSAEAPPVTTTEAPPPDTDDAATQALQALKNQDAATVAQVVGQWLPQLGSKHGTPVWSVDPEDNVTYTPLEIWREHQRLRQQYGAVLVWSGDWTVWDQQDYWVTIVPRSYSDSDSVLSWCRSVQRDKDHCSAQIVSNTLGPNDNTHALQS